MWLSLLLRWAHLIVGIAWIGASFYFNWLENHLQRQNQPENIAGDLWAVHGGGFYHLKKFALAPGELPPTLHWFKWEAYATWISGMALLIVVFYWNAQTYMLNPLVTGVTPAGSVGIGIGALLSSWVFYDIVCCSRLSRQEWLAGLIIFAWFVLLSWILSTWLSGRAAYIHVGAAIGTIMVANVFRVIIP
ncbi:MAG: urate hydroxylase PuuD, partial [Gammaproteobacteria bacterium]|nr:urate hydroxylase PuuD [Gammaproteobacteria bacterium]